MTRRTEQQLIDDIHGMARQIQEIKSDNARMREMLIAIFNTWHSQTVPFSHERLEADMPMQIVMSRVGEYLFDNREIEQVLNSAEPRYVVVGPAASDDSPTGQAWHIKDRLTGHGVIVNERCWYATEAEAQAAADNLNNGGA